MRKLNGEESRRGRFGGPRVPFGILGVALVLASILTYQAFEAERSEHATAWRVLNDYARFAAWQFSRNAKEELYVALSELLIPVRQLDVRSAGESLPGPEILAKSARRVALCACAPTLDARYYFRVDLREGRLVTAGPASPPAAEARWLVDTVAAHARDVYGLTWQVATIIGSGGGRSRALAYTLVRDGAGRPLAAYGLETDPAAYGASIFPAIARRAALLPPTLTSDAPNDSLMSITVVDGAGREVYQSPMRYGSDYVGAVALKKSFEGLTVRVALRPDVAERVLIGGVHCRFYLFVALVTLTAVLITAAFLMLRREAELARLRSEFVAGVSHELRTPLAQIRMFAELLRLGWVRSDDERRRSIDIIDQEARRLTHLVDNVLHFSRAERHAMRIAPEPTALAPLVREVVEAFAPLADARGTTLVLELDDGAAAPVDRCAFRQILLNLLDNAVKYGPAQQTVTVALDVRGAQALVVVDDQGPGIPADRRKVIWQAFARLDRAAEAETAGSGIGLAVVRQLVELHGGGVSVGDAPEGGARFTVELPGATTTDRPAPSPAPAAPLGAREEAAVSA